jgi:hypothetical protein
VRALTNLGQHLNTLTAVEAAREFDRYKD